MLSSVCQSLTVAAAVCDGDGRVLAVSGEASALFRRTHSELVGRQIEAMVEFDQLGGETWAGMSRPESLAHGRVVTDDGQAHRVEVRSSVVQPAGEQMVALVQFVPINDERNRFQRTAMTLLEALPVGVAVFDLDHRFLAINTAMCELNGMPRGHYIGRAVRDVFPMPFAATLSNVLDSVVATGEPQLKVPVSGYRLGHPDEPIHTEASWFPVLSSDGVLEATAAIVTDRTAENNSALAAQRQAQAIAALVSSMPTPVLLMDTQGRLVHANSAVRELASGSVHDNVNQRVGEFLPALAEIVTAVLDGPPSVGFHDTVEALPPFKELRVTSFSVAETGWGLAIEDLTEARADERRMIALAGIAARLAATDDLTSIAGVVEESLGEALGTSAAGTVVPDGAVFRFISMNGYPAPVEAAWRTFDRSIEAPITRAFLSGVAEYSDTQLDIVSNDPSMAETTIAAGVHALAAIPMVSDGDPVGVLALSWAQPRSLDQLERAWCQTLAGLLGQAIARSNRAAYDRQAAAMLQASLLPARLVVPEWLDVASAYHPAGADSVGGDLYDHVQLHDGTVALVVADICGRGIEAAAGTALVRHTLRTALQRGDDPATALDAVDTALATAQTPGVPPIATAVVVTLSPPTDGRSVITITSAGHPLPCIRRVDGTTQLVGRPGRLLGLGRAPLRPTLIDHLAPGDVLLAYTDGLTDTPRPRLDEQDLIDVVAAATSIGLADLLQLLVGLGDTYIERDDDTAIIAASILV